MKGASVDKSRSNMGDAHCEAVTYDLYLAFVYISSGRVPRDAEIAT